jgi:lipopolysaccharide/colanic/teichoic acid biosynthesis glycosyltransferase
MYALPKQIFDLALAIVLLIISAPLMGVITLLVWLESPGNVFFCQERLGVHGKRFWLWKFRKFPMHWGDSGPGVTVRGDLRMTTIGAILERTKLDELPQLWNILKGEMSFVGPRPESVRFAHLFKGDVAGVLRHIPGIFGPSQVAFRNESELYPADRDPEAYYQEVLFPQKARLDIEYFQKANCLTDINWIIRGMWVTIVGVVDWGRLAGSLSKTIAIDALLIQASWTVANLLRFSGLPTGEDYHNWLAGVLVLPPVMLTVMLLSGCYKNHPPRYFCFVDVVRLLGAVSSAWIVGFFLIIGFVSRNISLYLMPLGWLTLMPALTGPRILSHINWEKKRKGTLLDSVPQIIIYGATPAGIALATWVVNGLSGINLIGFLDNASTVRGKKVFGYPVLGCERDIPTICLMHHVDEIWVVVQLEASKRDRIREVCKRQDIRLVMIPEIEPFSRFADAKIALRERNSMIPQTRARSAYRSLH